LPERAGFFSFSPPPSPLARTVPRPAPPDQAGFFDRPGGGGNPPPPVFFLDPVLGPGLPNDEPLSTLNYESTPPPPPPPPPPPTPPEPPILCFLFCFVFFVCFFLFVLFFWFSFFCHIVCFHLCAIFFGFFSFFWFSWCFLSLFFGAPLPFSSNLMRPAALAAGSRFFCPEPQAGFFFSRPRSSAGAG